MRFLHTADWHVGKTLAGRSRAPEHEAVLDEIAGIARDRAVDLTIVAGDLFDNAAPSPDSERIVFGALLALGKLAPVLVLPGNHDNERRLSALAPLFELAGVTIVPSIRPQSQKLTLSGEPVTIAVVPWLSQRHIVKAAQLMAKDADDHSLQYGERMHRIITSLCDQFTDDAVNLVAGHLTVAGAEMGGGERTAQTIFDYYVAPNFFPANAHYVALGHIHKKQSMPGPCPIHYCGAPLHLDFSDSPDERSVNVVVASPGTPAEIEHVPLASGRKLRTVRGTLGQLEAMKDSLGDDYLRVIVDEKSRIGLADEIREMFPNTVKVAVESRVEEKDKEPRRPGASPRDLFTHYLTERDIEDPALVALFDEIYEEVHAAAST